MKNIKKSGFDLNSHLAQHVFLENSTLFAGGKNTILGSKQIDDGLSVKTYTNEFWTSRQRQANSLHEISYRACFKPQLPGFFINLLTKEGDVVYDPFSGRGTTVIEAALRGRNIISNDVNPLSEILCKPRLNIPSITEIEKRLSAIPVSKNMVSEIDLDMFFHESTLHEILSLKQYLFERSNEGKTDYVDDWIRMVATNRLTGHSSGFFSVYTLPPNQALSPERQAKINTKRNQKPDYRDTKKIILAKSKSLLKNISDEQRKALKSVAGKALFINKDSSSTGEIKESRVDLTVTSPPFLDVVQYSNDNWMRFWFNGIDAGDMNKKITVAAKVEDWETMIEKTFSELKRITKPGGCIAFEVGEVKNGKISLDENVAKIGVRTGLECIGIMINSQTFTKTANIWGINNNSKGTNSNKIVIFRK